ncbi:MAG: protein phosphatase CheZ [Rhizobiales bacterium]|nr:protein phosphatase CheZ [Hyphomicrobiales bacterium]MBO6700491.1 protein phosphatase CheZ [Hyphomicrobiales bacterium]MBO6738027.1 protein phosphatase CheZ [Hyphomicrobiales bacterium]MBO6913666.1 protein phosphatase CheZ [Hyphomicrobiales bacterium]MBO6954437.1 protein phosphatase CheZ [Hyphomicrobiales bacterium]
MAKNEALDISSIVEKQAEALVACVNNGPGQKKLDMVRALDVARVMTDSLEGTLRSLEHGFADAVREAAEDIHDLRNELSSLGVDKLRADHLPEAGKELDAVVEETEKATNRIMESAESIMAADRSDPEAFQEMVDTQMIDIFEACTFQDITGQRIGKVVETLQRLEGRFDRLLESLPKSDGEAFSTDEEKARERRKEEQILNGPQRDGPQVDQDAIDALFG